MEERNDGLLQLFAEAGEAAESEAPAEVFAGEEPAEVPEAAEGAAASEPELPQEHLFAAHFLGLERQAEAMREVFPDFDLRAALHDPAFARMTAPDVGIRVEDAWYALHRDEIQSAAMQVAAQRTAQMISDSIRSGRMRPSENGTRPQGAGITGFDYRAATPQQRSALKKRIREAASRGEKLYPGM